MKIFAILTLVGLPTIASADPCAIEAWKQQMRGTVPMMTGATTCESGELIYRLYDAETDEFLTSGFHYFSGFAFQAYPEIAEWPNVVDIRYVIKE